MANLRNQDNNTHLFRVVHPLDEVPEQKLSHAHLGRIRMTPAVRISLTVLRIYLLVMIVLVIYRVFVLAGAFGHH